MDLEGDATAAATAMAKTLKAPVGPDDLSAYNLDDYDEEVSKGAGESVAVAISMSFVLMVSSSCSDGSV